ncbi:MAG: isocitrate lyase/phosphoenolpyruvate mutase family protein [Vulcanimicrobiaceae bacterium]
MNTQREKADLFLKLHEPANPVLLVNAWDAVSARIIETLGFPAVATTSAGVAFLEGFPDGERIGREAMLAGVARVTRAVSVPVTADLEAGYGESVEDAAVTARGALRAGAVGLNFEDALPSGDRLFEVQHQAERVRAIRSAGEAAGIHIVINARTDVYLNEIGAPAGRLEEALARGRAYHAAGADCIFVPGVIDPKTIDALVRGMGAPVSVLASAKAPPLAELRALGVARISLGSGPMLSALSTFRDIAMNYEKSGAFHPVDHAFTHSEANALFK